MLNVFRDWPDLSGNTLTWSGREEWVSRVILTRNADFQQYLFIATFKLVVFGAVIIVRNVH